MYLKHVLAIAAGVAMLSLVVPASAESLAVPPRHRHRAPADGAYPVRGLSMAQVEGRYGAPLEKLSPAGGDTARHPVIHRWRYRGYTVYFERNRVIHTVPDAATIQPPKA
jgi:hypothetical protein